MKVCKKSSERSWYDETFHPLSLAEIFGLVGPAPKAESYLEKEAIEAMLNMADAPKKSKKRRRTNGTR